MKIGINYFLKLWSNLVSQLLNMMDLILLIKFC